MNNSEMKAGRILKLHNGRKKLTWILNQLKAGRQVATCTHLRITTYSNPEYFKMAQDGSLYARRGRNWDCIDFTNLRSIEN